MILKHGVRLHPKIKDQDFFATCFASPTCRSTQMGGGESLEWGIVCARLILFEFKGPNPEDVYGGDESQNTLTVNAGNIVTL